MVTQFGQISRSHDLRFPRTRGLGEMYPPQRLFSSDRADWEKRHFGTRQDHAPNRCTSGRYLPTKHAIALSQYTTRVFCILRLRSRQRMLGCYMYRCGGTTPGEVIQQKAELFGKRVPIRFRNYERQFEEWLVKFKKLGQDMEDSRSPGLGKFVLKRSDSLSKGFTAANELMEKFNIIINLIFRACSTISSI